MGRKTMDSESEKACMEGVAIRSVREQPPIADFALLRLLLALTVVFAHLRELTARSSGISIPLSSTVAVQAFFVVSGWVVGLSYLRDPRPAPFFARRAARLIPLYAVVVSLQALFATAIAEAQGRLVDGGELLRYLLANLAFANFLQPSLYGLLDDAPVNAINPSLWTLKIELGFYLAVPLLVALLRRRGRAAMTALFVLSTLVAYAWPAESSELGRQLPGQLRFFIVGLLASQLRIDASSLFRRAALLCASLLAALLAHEIESVPSATAFQPLIVGLFVLAAGYSFPRLPALPDLSYGVYLIHAPLVQLVQATPDMDDPYARAASVLGVTVLLATASHYWVELPGIRLGRSLSARLGARQPAPAVMPKTLEAGLQRR